MNSTVEFEADFVPFKLATDVVLNGKAYAPYGQPTSTFTASLCVGSHRKDVRVIGDRVCRYREADEPVFTEPKPVTVVDLRYENAYGGVDIYSDPRLPCAYPRNFLGKGFVIVKSKRALDNLALPNLDDPNDVLTPGRLSCEEVKHWERQPMPQSFWWFSKTCRPRALLASDRWVQAPSQGRGSRGSKARRPREPRCTRLRAPRYGFPLLRGASPGLALPYLAGHEQVRLTNLAREGETTFELPGERPRIEMDIGEEDRKAGVVLHTLLIRLEDRQVDLFGGPRFTPA
jgi:hypothetical protein